MEQMFRALADRTRLRLLNLMSGQEVCVCYFIEILGLPQSTISRHLAYMRRAGLVHARREGKWMHYSILRPADRATCAILDAALNSCNDSPQMRSDLSRLGAATCEPQRFVTLQGAPLPTRVPS